MSFQTGVEGITGKERDSETGLDYFGARYFSAAQGRFTSPDPNQAGANLFDPRSWNGYSYVNNRPLSYVDDDGHFPIPVITGLIGGGVGAVIGGGAEALKQWTQYGEIRQGGKIWTAAMGGAVAGAIAGATLGVGTGAGAATATWEVAAVNASSNLIGGMAQREADEILGYDSPSSGGTELQNVLVDATTGAVLGSIGNKVADKLFPIPNVQKQVRLLRFANRRSTRPARIQAAQQNAERQAIFNSAVGGVAGGTPTEGAKWLWQWLMGSWTVQRSQPKACVEVSDSATGTRSKQCE